MTHTHVYINILCAKRAKGTKKKAYKGIKVMKNDIKLLNFNLEFLHDSILYNEIKRMSPKHTMNLF